MVKSDYAGSRATRSWRGRPAARVALPLRPSFAMTQRGNRIESTLLRRINERRLLEVIQQQGPSSRAHLSRLSGLTAPTVSKAVDSLLRRGFLEELEAPGAVVGRPGKLVRMAADTAVVLGVVVDVAASCVVVAGLDGRIMAGRTRAFPTPSTYAALLDAVERECRAALAGSTATLRGIGISVPGLVNARTAEVVYSPNLHLLDGRDPASDLHGRLGVPGVLLQEADALCFAERLHGAGRGVEHVVLLDVSHGLGLSVMSGGHVLAGRSGMAGELGHVTMQPDGIRCGCGNRGCLETLATDAALVRLLGDACGTAMTLEAAADLLATEPERAAEPVAIVGEYLAIAIAAAINIFNPSTLLVHGTLLVGDAGRFARVIERVRMRALGASLADCTILPTRSSKREGAVAGIIHALTDACAPAVHEARSWQS